MRASEEFVRNLGLNNVKPIAIYKVLDILFHCIENGYELEGADKLFKEIYGKGVDLDVVRALTKEIEIVKLLDIPKSLALWVQLSPIVKNCKDVESMSVDLDDVLKTIRCVGNSKQAESKQIARAVDDINNVLTDRVLVHKQSRGKVIFCALYSGTKYELKQNLQDSGLQTASLIEKHLYE